MPSSSGAAPPQTRNLSPPNSARRGSTPSRRVIDAGAGDTAEPIGFAAISAFNPRPGYDGICALAYYITPQWQGRGAGKYALGVLIDECRARAMRMACTVIFADNAASSGLMERFGFTRYGLLPQAAYDSKGTLHDVGFWSYAL